MALYIPNSFFTVYGYIAKVGAGIFIVIQSMYLVDFAYEWTESWRGNYEENGEPSWLYALIGATAVLFLSSFVGSILLFVYFGSGSDCWSNIIYISLNLVISFLITGFSISSKIQEYNPSVGLLQSAVVAFYCTWLLSSALMSEPTSCNPTNTGNDATEATSTSTTIMLVIGTLITIIAMCYSIIRLAGQEQAGEEELGSVSNPKDGAEAAPLNAEEHDDHDHDDESRCVKYNYTYFHITHALGAMYIGQLLTDWENISIEQNTEIKIDFGWTSVWVKLVSSWVVFALYLWTMFAPALFPDRVFAK